MHEQRTYNFIFHFSSHQARPVEGSTPRYPCVSPAERRRGTSRHRSSRSHRRLSSQWHSFADNLRFSTVDDTCRIPMRAREPRGIQSARCSSCGLPLRSLWRGQFSVTDGLSFCTQDFGSLLLYRRCCHPTFSCRFHSYSSRRRLHPHPCPSQRLQIKVKTLAWLTCCVGGKYPGTVYRVPLANRPSSCIPPLC